MNPKDTTLDMIHITPDIAKHICEVLSRGLYKSLEDKFTFTSPCNGTQTMSFLLFWSAVFPKRSRRHWEGYLMKLGIPKNAIDVAEGTVVGTMVLGAMIHNNRLGTHPLVPLGNKEPPYLRLAWPSASSAAVEVKL